MKTLREVVRGAAAQGCLTGDTEGQETWIVGPCGRHRDSELIDESNFEVLTSRLREADPDENDHTVVRFGHWGVGWIEEIATRPGSRCAEIAQEAREALESYAILDDDHHSSLEACRMDDNWPQIARDLKDQIKEHCSKEWEGWDDESADILDDLEVDQIWEAAHEYGEITEGWVKYSASNVEKIASKLMRQLGFES